MYVSSSTAMLMPEVAVVSPCRSTRVLPTAATGLSNCIIFEFK